MSGEVEASLERVILAENGIGLRLVFVNHRNAPVGIAFGQQTLNGQKPERDAAPNLQVPANGRAIYAFSITDDRFMQREERITRVGFSFQINGEFSSEAAHILIDPNAETGYLSPDDYATEPVTFYQPVISFKNPEQYTEGQYALSVKGLFLNGSQDANVDTWYDTDQTHLELTLNLTNLTDTSQYYKFSNFVVNGQAMTDVFWMVGSVESGGSAASTRKINLEQLRGVDHIADISCEMTYYEPDHYEEKTTVPLRFEVKDCDVTELTPEAITPLCSGFDGGLNWEILSLTPDPNGGFTALLRASNQGPEAVSGGYVYMAVDDVVTGHFLTQALQPGMHQYFTVSFDDEIRIPKYEIDVFQSPYAGEGRYYPLERHVLEHRGVSAITQIQLFGDLRYSGQNPHPGRTVRLELPAAVPLQSSEGADTHMHPMREGELSIWQGDMLIGDNGVALVLNVINGTDQIIELKPAQLQLNGLDCPNYGTYYSIVAMPHTQRVQHISILTEGHEDEFQKGRVIREVTITLETQSGSSFTGRIALDQAAPLGRGGRLDNQRLRHVFGYRHR